MDARSVGKTRHHRERMMRLLDPVVHPFVRVAARAGLDPLWLVTAHGVAGLTAALAIALPVGGSLAWAAAALVVRTVLDNADGALARATGRVTRMGRYYDTGVDLIVNAAIFAALGVHAGFAVVVPAFMALTLVLSLDHNMDRLYRIPRTVPEGGPPAPPVPVGAPRRAYRLFRALYRVVLAPQDRLVERLDRRAFERLEGAPYDQAPLDRRLAWSDRFSVAAVTDLGLSTQSLLLAALLLLGLPHVYPYLVLVMLAWALLVQPIRAARYRAYQAADPEIHRHAG